MLLNEPAPVDVRGARRPAVEVGDKNHVAPPVRHPDRAVPRQAPQDPGQSRDPEQWLDTGLEQPLPAPPADGVLDLLAPVLDGPLLRIDRPPLPPVSELAALHRAELEADFAEPPVMGVGDEPPIPARFAAGLPVLPHIDFPA